MKMRPILARRQFFDREGADSLRHHWRTQGVTVLDTRPSVVKVHAATLTFDGHAHELFLVVAYGKPESDNVPVAKQVDGDDAGTAGVSR